MQNQKNELNSTASGNSVYIKFDSGFLSMTRPSQLLNSRQTIKKVKELAKKKGNKELIELIEQKKTLTIREINKIALILGVTPYELLFDFLG